MAAAATVKLLNRARSEPLSGYGLAAECLIVWLAGALYCAGYDALRWEHHDWRGSLLWSAAAVLPWLALFEWSKSRGGRKVSSAPLILALVLVATGMLSLALEFATDLATDGQLASIPLAMLRRLPPIGTSLILILWARNSSKRPAAKAELNITAIGSSIDWVAAADNYVELHVGGRVLTRRMTMADAEQALRPYGFVRVHRCYLVNVERILDIGASGSWTVKLEGGAELPVGGRYAANLGRRT